MLIYWAAMVPPRPTYNIIYTVSNFPEYVPIKCDGVVRDTE